LLQYSQRKIRLARALERFADIFKRILLRKPTPASQPPLILLIEPFQMGDVLSLAVLFDPLLERFPGAKIVIWCHDRNAAVYANDAGVHLILTAPFPWSSHGSKRGSLSHWIAVLRSCRRARSLRPDIAIDVRGDIRSQLLMLAAGSPQRIGYTTYVHSNLCLRGLLLSDPLADIAEKHRYLTNLNALTPLLGSAPPLHLPALNVPRTTSETFTIAIHPGAGWLYKRWDPTRWAALITRLLQHPNMHLFLIAGPGELALCDEINSLLPSPLEVVSTNFDGLLRTIASVNLFIGLDSGPMNAATLMNIPVIALFGPGESSVWHPLSHGSRFFHHVENYPCHPCTQITCVRAADPCMTAIHADEVYAAALPLLPQ